MNFTTDHLTRKVPAMLRKSARTFTATVRHYFGGGTGVDNPFARWRFLRPVSAVVLTAFTMLSTAPAVAAVRQDAAQQQMAAANGPSAAERYAQLLDRIKAVSEGNLRSPDLAVNDAKALQAGDIKATLKALAKEADTLVEEMDRDTESILEKFRAANVDATIIQRTESTRDAVRAKHKEIWR